jgi:hypothetical protein
MDAFGWDWLLRFFVRDKEILPEELKTTFSARHSSRAARHFRRYFYAAVRTVYFAPAAAFDALETGCYHRNAGWSSLVARWAHNPKVGGSNPPPATNSTVWFQWVEPTSTTGSMTLIPDSQPIFAILFTQSPFWGSVLPPLRIFGFDFLISLLTTGASLNSGRGTCSTV